MTATTPRTIMAVAVIALLSGSAPTALALQADGPPITHEFQITLISARPGQPQMPELPSDALDALVDVSRLLPYQSFELIDSGWMRTHGDARLRMGEAGSFDTYLHFSAGSEDGTLLLIDHFELDHRDFWRDDGGRVHFSDPENLLASVFGIAIGETVVVGTSRLTGGEALIVLLKAVK